MNAFEVMGAILAIWALLVSFLGITREDFPGRAEKVVGAISVILVVAAIGTAIYVGVTEKKEVEGKTGVPSIPL
jgi:hypothetical protein